MLVRPPIDGRRPLFIIGEGTSNCIPPPLPPPPPLGDGGVRNETDGRRARSDGAKNADADAASPAASGFSDERRSELAWRIPGGPPPPPVRDDEIAEGVLALPMSAAIDAELGLPCIAVPAAAAIACVLAKKVAACAPFSDSDPRRGCASSPLPPLIDARRKAAAEADDDSVLGGARSGGG